MTAGVRAHRPSIDVFSSAYIGRTSLRDSRTSTYYRTSACRQQKGLVLHDFTASLKRPRQLESPFAGLRGSLRSLTLTADFLDLKLPELPGNALWHHDIMTSSF